LTPAPGRGRSPATVSPRKRAEGLRPSEVATRQRARTQPEAARLFETHGDAGRLRWWSSLEALWINVTLFDRLERQVGLAAVEELTLNAEPVPEAAALGLR